jgi:hypothetical protein
MTRDVPRVNPNAAVAVVPEAVHEAVIVKLRTSTRMLDSKCVTPLERAG